MDLRTKGPWNFAFIGFWLLGMHESGWFKGLGWSRLHEKIPGCQPGQVEGTLPGGFRGLPRRQRPGKSQ